MTTYGAFASKERPGWFLGLTGPQLIGLGLGGVPAWLSVATGAWASLLLTLPGWGLIVIAVCLPVRGWSAWQWCGVVARYQWGRISGWNAFQSRAAAGDLTVDVTQRDTPGPHHTNVGSHHSPHHASVEPGERSGHREARRRETQAIRHLELDIADLPGALGALRIHSVAGPGGTAAGLGLVEDRRRQTWAATVRLSHPGIGLADQPGRDLMGSGLTGLLEAAAASEAIEMLALHVRATPETRADREAWVRDHTVATRPELSAAVHAELEYMTAAAAVRHEAYLTVVVSDRRLARGAGRGRRDSEGRARLLSPLLAEVEGHLLGAMGCTHARWLSSTELAAVVRAGFDPADPAADPHAADPGTADPGTAGPGIADPSSDGSGGRVSWATSGPVTAAAGMRNYQHGAWQSVASTLVLPRNGALMGALARVLVPDRAGERRSLMVMLRPVGRGAALRSTERSGTSAAMAAELRRRVGRDERASDRRAAARVREADEKIERGRALVKVGIIAVATVPATWDAHDAGRRLDAASRTCEFVAVPLDGAQDSAFAAGALPLGAGLPNLRGRL